MSADQTSDERRPSASIDFHMIKSHHFRVVHVDGAFGGIAPSGNVHAAFYSERTALPQRVTHEIKESGDLGGEIARHGKSGITREIEVDLVMSLVVAKNLRKWLEDKIEQLEVLEAAAKSATKQSKRSPKGVGEA